MYRKLMIDELRKKAGISKYRLHLESGVTWPTITILCGSPVMPDRTQYKTLRRIADCFEVSLDELESEPIEGDPPIIPELELSNDGPKEFSTSFEV